MNDPQHLPGPASATGFPAARARARLQRQVQASRSAWWDGAPWLALLLIAVSAVRLPELVPATGVLQPALLSTVGGGALLLIRNRRPARQTLLHHPLMRLVAAYWAFMILTVPFALWPGQAFGTVRYFLPAVVLAAALLSCAPHLRTLRRLQVGFVVAVAVYAGFALLLGSSRSGRLSVGMGAYDSNDMAALLAIGLPLAAGLVRSERRWLRFLFAGIAVVLVLGVVSSGSRSGALGMGAGALVFVLGLKGTRRLLGIGVLLASLLLVWNVSASFQERMVSLTNLEEDYNTTHEYGRKAVWKRGRQYIRENPILGVGVGNFPMAEGQYFGETYSGLRGGKWSAAHNAYVQAYAELGLIGGSLFVAILWFGLWHGWRLWRGVRDRGRLILYRPEFLASLAAYLVSAVFLSHAYFIPAIALLGMTALAERIAREKKTSLRRRNSSPTQTFRGVRAGGTGYAWQPRS